MKGKAEEAKNKAGVWELASRKRQQDKSQKFEENYISMTVALDAMHESKTVAKLLNHYNENF